MIRVKIHPAFWIFAFATVLEGKYIHLIATLAVVIMHELAHSRVAYHLGYVLTSVTIMPYGAMLSGGDMPARKDALPIAAAGPISNLTLCICLYALWWAIPATYAYTKPIFDASLTVAIFNLLPFYPLDGARIIMSLAKRPLKAMSILKFLGKLGGISLFVLYLISYFGELNYSLGAVGVLLYISAEGGTENETYRHLYDVIPYTKQLNSPIMRSTIIVHDGLKLIRLIRHINASSYTTFEVVDDALNVIATLDEKEVGELILNNSMHSTIKEVLPAWREKRRA